MSTRACYTFKDLHNTFHVYKHYDGYPSGAEQWIGKALPLAWPLPRFEADEFGAAFIVANKEAGGDCRLVHSGDIKDVAPGDIQYRYEIEVRSHDGALYVTAFSTSYWRTRTEELLWEGPFSAMKEWAAKHQS